MTIPQINLDDEREVREFISTHGTTRGRMLANRLGLSGAGSQRLANSFSNYAWNKLAAIDIRIIGNIETALKYEQICDKIYARIPAEFRPW